MEWLCFPRPRAAALATDAGRVFHGLGLGLGLCVAVAACSASSDENAASVGTSGAADAGTADGTGGGGGGDGDASDGSDGSASSGTDGGGGRPDAGGGDPGDTTGGPEPTWSVVASGVTVTLYDVSFGDSDHAWAVGDGGTILASSDGGLTWMAQESGSKAVLRAVDFIDASTGWAVGDGDPDAPGLAIGAHSISNRPRQQGTCLVTTDGGASWSTRFLNTNFELRTVATRSATAMQVGTHGGEEHADGDSFVTSDGGSTWNDGWSQRVWHGVNASAWLGETDLLVMGSGVGISVSPAPGGSLYENKKARILGSTDGGYSYTVVPSPEPDSTYDQLRGLWLGSDGLGFAVGDVGWVVQTTNGGGGWSRLTSGTTADLHGVAFADESTGWAVGPGGTWLETLDSGSTWSTGASPAGATALLGMDAFDERVIVVGAKGTIITRS